MRESDVRILVAVHQDAYVPKIPCVEPIQVGTALAESRLEGMLHDDAGENISDKNGSYCELTAQYWAWKNLEADYYGFFHYRRYMSFVRAYPVRKPIRINSRRWREHMGYEARRTEGNSCRRPTGTGGIARYRGGIAVRMQAARRTPYMECSSIHGDLSVFGLDEAHIRGIVEAYDVVTVCSERMNVTVYQQFSQFHDRADLDLAAAIIKRRYPEYQKALETYMNAKDIYFCNMFIMKRRYFHKYMEWLFPILEEMEQRRGFKDSSGSGKGQREAGYVAERLFGVFYTYLKMQGKADCCELQYVIFYDTAPDEPGQQQEAEATGVRPRVFCIGKWRLAVDMRRVNRLLPAGSIRRRAVRTVMGRFL